MKKWILPLLAAVFVLQGCADKETQASAVAESAAPVTEEYSEGESRKNLRRRHADERRSPHRQKRQESHSQMILAGRSR